MTRSLRVLIVEPHGQAGHWHYAFTLARALSQRAVDVRLATPFPFEVLEGTGEIAISIIGHRPHGSTAGFPHRRVLEHAGKIRGLVRVIQEFEPHVVHIHDSLGMLDFAYFKLIKHLGARVVYTAHDLTPSRWLDLSNRLRYRATDLILVHSLNSIDDLGNYGIERSKIAQIPHISLSSLAGNGVLSRDEAKASIGLSPETRAVLFFGRIDPRKGLDLLIDAHAKLCRDLSQVCLIIAGQPNGDFVQYRERIVKSGLSERVILDLRYIPFDRARVYFSAADVVALPYRKIYQSGVLQWAYAFGRPVVVTDIGGIREAVAADGTGLIVGEADGEGLARAILSLLSDEELARAMGHRGLEMARTKYSWEAVSKRLEGIYRELVTTDAVTSSGRIMPMRDDGTRD